MSSFVNQRNPAMTISSIVAVAIAALFGIVTTGCSDSAHNHKDHTHTDQTKDAAKVNNQDNANTPKADYPTDVCVVSDEKLGSMGKPVIVQHDGREVRLCCKGCIEQFNEDPKKYIAKLDAARKP